MAPLASLAALLLSPAALAGARPITPDYDGNCQAPRWSRNGARLAYEVNYHDRKVIELYVYTPGGGDPRRVQPVQRGASTLTAGFGTGAAESVAHEASWGPAFIDRFVYSATNDKRDQDLYIDQASAIAPSLGADGGAAWSPDGRWIAFTSARTGQGDLYLIDAHQIDQPPRQLTREPSSSELYATWSPDGSKLVYVGHTDTGDSLWLLSDLATPKPKRLTDWGQTQTRPTISPDGKQVAFYSNHDDPERWDLYAMSLAGGEPTRLAQGVVMDARGPAWTPDSREVVYVQDDDAAFDPVWRVPLGDVGAARKVPTGTVGNGDLDVTRGTDGATWLALTAQGRAEDTVRDFKRIYVMQLGN